ncbi:TCR/Tet family MFS transporter [Candidatus Marimicrobium litorale]|uniref:MFS transporter n=1 Tax=Candidatus Marimicrobium litorale TaxID=2518991 RepID=A0ABT3T719_9GAMM|nr:TCR/Tet family MFS transporter [Candidatus Marimicrobium litorale]MCX2977985.1 MFS transporter [Candidatus Marimicrobium litorale]
MRPTLAFAFIFVTVLLDSIGFGIIMPVVPHLIMDITGDGLADAARIAGLLMFTFAAMQFIASPILGNLSDRYGRRPILLFSLLAMGCNFLLMGWAPTLVWLFFGRIISGVSASTYGTANAYIADTFPPEKRAQYFALLGAGFGMGFIIGPAIGGVLGEYGPRTPFFAAAGLTFVNVIYGFFVLPESLKPENRRAFNLARANPLAAIRQLWRYPVVVMLLLVSFFYSLGHFALPSVWAFFTIEKFQWTPRDIGISLSAVGVAMIFVQAYLIRLVLPLWGPMKTAVVGLIATAISFFGYAFIPFAWMMYVVIAIGALQGFVMPSIQSMMSERVPANAQGELQGAIGSLNGLVTIISPLFMAELFAYFSGPEAPLYFPGAPFFAAAILTLLALVLLLRVRRNMGRA